MTILSGYVATPVPGPVVVATEIPGPTVVPTPVPFWLREIFGYLAAEGEITVQVGGIRMDSTEAVVRGNGRVAAAVSSVWLSAPEQLLTGLGRLEVMARFGANAGTKLLEGVGSVVLSSFAPKLPAGVRTLAGRGAVTASGILYRLRPAGVTLAGRGEITASVTAEKLNAGTRTLAAGRGAFVVASISKKLSAPSFVSSAETSGGASGTTTAATIPGGGTTLIMGVSHYAASLTVPSGWTLVTSKLQGFYSYLTILERARDGSEGSTVNVTGNTYAPSVMIVAVDGVTSVASSTGGSSGTTAECPSITPTGPGITIRFAATMYYNASYSWPAGQTALPSATGSTQSLGTAWAEHDATIPTVTVTTNPFDCATATIACT